MAGLVARTVASGDGLQTVALVVTNDQATYLIRPPRGLPPGDIQELIELGRRGAFVVLAARNEDATVLQERRGMKLSRRVHV